MTDTASPYSTSWAAYADRGWCPIPLPADAKYPPPDGVTGDRGRPPSRAQCAAWAADGAHNIGVRLNGDTIGLDVDHYGDKTGADTLAALEAEHGPLPLTWSSTSRGADSPSRIYFYRVPDGTRLRAAPGPSIEAIQRHHRYAVVWPSIHPKTGETYQWYDDAGEAADHPPTVDDLAELPWAWIEGLRSIGGPTADAAAPEQVAEFMAGAGEQNAPYRLDGIRTRLDAMPAGSSRHDTLIEVACWAMREAAAGCYTANAAEAELRQWWDRVMDDAGRRDGTEFGDAIAWAVAQAGLDPARIAKIKGDIADPNDAVSELVLAPRSSPVPAVMDTEPTDHDWPEPLPLRERPDLPAWPVHIFPAWMADHIRETADQLQVPVDLCAQFALGAVAAAAMGYTSVVVGGRWREPLNLYLATALPSGGGKSPAEKAMTRPIREWEARQRELSMAEVNEAEVRRKVLQKQADDAERGAAMRSVDISEAVAARQALDEHEMRWPFRRLADDATPEQLTQLLHRQRGLIAVLSTEAELLDMAAGAYSGRGVPNISVYLKAFSGDTIMVDRKGGSGQPGTELRIDHPLLTVGLAMQPSVIDFVGRQNAQLEGRGFLARFLYSCPEPGLGTRDRSRVLDAPDTAAADTYGRELTVLAEKWMWPVDPMHLTPDAERMFVANLQDQEHEMDGRYRAITAWMAKLQSSTLRVAGLLHLLWGRPATQPIDVDIMGAAIEAGEYWIAHALAIAVDPVDHAAAQDAESILEVAARKQLDVCTPRDLWTPLRGRFERVSDMVTGLEALEAGGYVRLIEGRWDDVGVRRATVRIEFSPRALARVTRFSSRSVAGPDHVERSNARNARNGIREGGSIDISLHPITPPPPYPPSPPEPPRVTRVSSDDELSTVAHPSPPILDPSIF